LSACIPYISVVSLLEQLDAWTDIKTVIGISTARKIVIVSMLLLMTILWFYGFSCVEFFEL
jgi:hypothetical protein